MKGQKPFFRLIPEEIAEKSFWAFPEIDVARSKTVIESSETSHFLENWLLYHSRLLKQEALFATIGPKPRFSRKPTSECFEQKCPLDKRKSVV